MSLEMMLFKARNWLTGNTKTEEEYYDSLQELLKELPFKRAHVKILMPSLKINTTLLYDLMASVLEGLMPDTDSTLLAQKVTYEQTRLRKTRDGYKTVTSKITRVVVSYVNPIKNPSHPEIKAIIDYTTQ